jgi:hypothetical protein
MWWCNDLAVEWGDVPNWVAAVATVGALIAAGVAALYAKGAHDSAVKAYDLEVVRERDARLQRDLWQASAVDVWEDQTSGAGQLGRLFYGVTVSNGSPTPIRDVTISWYDPNTGSQLRGQLTQPLVPPGETFISRATELRIPNPVPDVNGNPTFSEPLDGFPITMRFRDSAGVYWLREKDGILRRD